MELSRKRRYSSASIAADLLQCWCGLSIVWFQSLPMENSPLVAGRRLRRDGKQSACLGLPYDNKGSDGLWVPLTPKEDAPQLTSVRQKARLSHHGGMHKDRPRRHSIQSRPKSALSKEIQSVSLNSINEERLMYCSGNSKCTRYRRGPRSDRRVARQSPDPLLKASSRRASLVSEDNKEEIHQQKMFLHGGAR